MQDRHRPVDGLEARGNGRILYEVNNRGRKMLFAGNGGPADSTDVVSLFIYQEAFGAIPFAYGYASHKDRQLSPMVRDTIDDEWRAVSWDEAIHKIMGGNLASLMGIDDTVVVVEKPPVSA